MADDTAHADDADERMAAVVDGMEAMLARDDAALGSVAPVLRHLLSHDDHSMFSDEIVARVRGMSEDVARQLLGAIAEDEAGQDPDDDRSVDALAALLIENSAFLCHLHALALEWRLTERLQLRLALDPVLSPLLQALIGSNDAAISSSAMNLLAAQVRFCQAQRRMQLPIGELPGDLLHGALLALRSHAGPYAPADERAERAEQTIRKSYDEGGSRLGLIARAVAGMGGGIIAALSVSHAGVAIFATALAAASGQDRDAAVLAASEGQAARLALALRAAGLKTAAIEEQFHALYPGAALPRGVEHVGARRAAELLSLSGESFGTGA